MSVDVKYTTQATANGGRDGHARTECQTASNIFHLTGVRPYG